MPEVNGLTGALIGFARTLTAGYDISDVLHDLAGRVSGVLAIAGAGVSLRQDDVLRFVTADTEAIATLEREQEQEQDGPCMDALRSGEPVAVPDLTEQGARWPHYTALAVRLGIVAVAAIPMRNAARIGVLDLYDTHTHDWSQGELATARVFTDIATAYVLHASELTRERRTVEQLQRALESRVVIEQAKGIVAADRGITVDQAFALLRKHANDRNATLRAVAEAVVNLGLRP
jgi:hypothetical protein